MKKIVLIASLFVVMIAGLSSCVVVPHPYGYGGYPAYGYVGGGWGWGHGWHRGGGYYRGGGGYHGGYHDHGYGRGGRGYRGGGGHSGPRH